MKFPNHIAGILVPWALAFMWMTIPSSALADEGSFVGPVSLDQAPPELQAELANAQEKALVGARWILALSTDGRTLDAYFISGTAASGSFATCPIVPQFTLRILRDGVQIFGYSSNAFGLIFAGNNTCGLHYQYRPGVGPVVDPAQWDFRLEEPGYGAPVIGSLAVSACRYKTPLYQTVNATVNDYFYTVLPSERDIALNQYAYSNLGVAANMESVQIAGSLPFKRFYKWLPQTDHFYTISSADESYVLSNGWVFERIEGYAYPTQKPGTVPLYRLNQWFPATSDLEHFYTTSTAARDGKLQQGWASDGIVGYVCP